MQVFTIKVKYYRIVSYFGYGEYNQWLISNCTLLITARFPLDNLHWKCPMQERRQLSPLPTVPCVWLLVVIKPCRRCYQKRSCR